jgi:hypothetical protein
MTESEWWACNDPDEMLRFLGDRMSDRELRLLAAACFTHVFEDEDLIFHYAYMLEGQFRVKATDSRSKVERSVRVSAGHAVSLLRDIAGNPIQVVPLPAGWRTPVVLALAQAIYDERRFVELPVLADALEEAGCMDPAILGHCRGPGPHVRGCWLVDQLLGKR